MTREVYMSVHGYKLRPIIIIIADQNNETYFDNARRENQLMWYKHWL